MHTWFHVCFICKGCSSVLKEGFVVNRVFGMPNRVRYLPALQRWELFICRLFVFELSRVGAYKYAQCVKRVNWMKSSTVKSVHIFVNALCIFTMITACGVVHWPLNTSKMTKPEWSFGSPCFFRDKIRYNYFLGSFPLSPHLPKPLSEQVMS